MSKSAEPTDHPGRDTTLLGIVDDICEARHLVRAEWMAANYLENPKANPLCTLLDRIEHQLEDIGSRTLAYIQKQ